MLQKLIYAGGIFFFLLSLAVFWAKDIFWLDLLSHFRLQYLIIGILLIIIGLYFRKRLLMGLSILIISLNLIDILPLYFSNDTIKVDTSQKLKLLAINVLLPNTAYDKVAQEIKKWNPDLLILQEVSQKWLDELKSTLKEYPYQQLEPYNHPRGIALLSKIPTKFKVIEYVKNVSRPTILAHFEWQNEKIDLLAFHPRSPDAPHKFAERNQHFRAVSQARTQLANNLIVMGDLNITSFSPHFQEFIQQNKLRDSRQGFGLQTTWHKLFGLVQITIDHCLMSEKFKVIERKIGNNVGSDHLPVYVELGL